MTIRYRDLPAVDLVLKPDRQFDLPADARWSSISIGLNGDLHLSYYRDGEGSTILDGAGQPINFKKPDGAPFWFPKIQRFADGRWLVVESRTWDVQPNAYVFKSDRSFSHSFYAGDGIETVLIDPSDRIWIGYFDEGIFGTIPQVSGATQDVRFGPQGLVRLDQHGVMEFGYNDAVMGRDFLESVDCETPDINSLTAEYFTSVLRNPGYVRLIDDIYALTVDENGRIWLCPYSQFYLGSVNDDCIEFVFDEAPVAGATAISVGADHFVFFGGYDLECMVTIVERATERLRLIQLRDKNGAPLRPVLLATKGENAAALSSESLYRLDIDLLLDALGPWRNNNCSTVASALQYRGEESSYEDSFIMTLESDGWHSRTVPGKPRPLGNQPRDDGGDDF